MECPDSRHLEVRPWEIGALLAVVAVFLVLDASWQAANLRYPMEHGGRNARTAVELFRTGRLPMEQYPPLTALATAAAFALAGLSERVAVQSLAPFHLLYLLGCWWAGRQGAGRMGGLLAALGAGGAAWVAQVDHGYFHESALTAMLALAFPALLASRGFTRPGPTLGLGLALGLGMLAKWAILFYLGLPLVFVAALSVARSRSRAGLALAGATALGLLLTGAALRTLAAPEAVAGSQLLGGAWLVLSLGWCALGLVAARLRAGPEGWNPGAGVALATILAVEASLWWYVAAAPGLAVKTVDLAQTFPPGVAANAYLSTLSGSFWAFPAWLAAGTVAGLAHRQARQATALALLGTATAVACYCLSGVPPSNRYVTPAMALLAPVAFAWPGLWPRLAPLALAPLGFLALVQVGAWQPQVPTRPASASFDTPLAPWDSVPVAAPADRSPYPFEESMAVLRPAPDSVIGLLRHPEVQVEPDAFLLAAALQGVRVEATEVPWDSGAAPPYPFLVVATPPDMQRESVLARLPWLSRYRAVREWTVPDRQRWFLFRQETLPAGDNPGRP